MNNFIDSWSLVIVTGVLSWCIYSTDQHGHELSDALVAGLRAVHVLQARVAEIKPPGMPWAPDEENDNI